MTITKGDINILNVTGNIVITASATKVNTEPESTELYTNPTVSFDTNTYRANLTQDGYTETFYVSYARNEYTPGYVGIKQFYDDNAYPYYLTLASEGTSKFRYNGNIPVDGWHSHEGGYYENGYYLDLSTKAIVERNLNMKFSVNGLPTALIYDAMAHINNNAIGDAIKFEIDASAATYRIELVNIEDEVLGYNYTTEGSIQINEWMMNDYYGTYMASNIQIHRRWLSTIVHELGHCLGFDDEAEHVPTMYNYYRDIGDDEAMCCLQANDWVFLESEFEEKLGVDLRTCSSQFASAVNAASISSQEKVGRKVKFKRPYLNKQQLENKADIIVEGRLNYIETKKLNVSMNADQEVLIEYDIYTVDVANSIKGETNNITVKIPTGDFIVEQNAIYKMYLKQYANTPCSLLNLKQGIEKVI